MSTKLKILLGINTLTSVGQAAYSNHIQATFRFGRNHPNIDFILFTPNRMSIDRMRNEAAKQALINGYDYLCFLDDDILLPFFNCDPLSCLLEADADIAASWTIIRGYPFENMFFRWKDGERKHLEKYKDEDIVYNTRNLIECDAVGFSFVLIKCSLLKKVPAPYFVTGTYNTEDVYFCIKAREFKPDCSIVVDPRVVTGHMLEPEMVTKENKAFLKEYYEKAYPWMLPEEEPKESANRGEGYLEQVKSQEQAVA